MKAKDQRDSSPMSHLAPESKKPKRISRACDSCHLKKARCDGCNPCARCHLENRVCTYTQKRRQPIKVLERGYVDILESKFNKVLSSFMILVSEISKGEDCQKYVRDAVASTASTNEEKPASASKVVSLNTVIDRLQKSANATLMQSELQAIRGSDAIDNSVLRVPPDAQEKLQMETGIQQQLPPPSTAAKVAPPFQPQVPSQNTQQQQHKLEPEMRSTPPMGQREDLQNSRSQNGQTSQSGMPYSELSGPLPRGLNIISETSPSDSAYPKGPPVSPGAYRPHVSSYQPSSDIPGSPLQQHSKLQGAHPSTPYTPQYYSGVQGLAIPGTATTPSNKLKQIGAGYADGNKDRVRYWLQQQDTLTQPTAGPRLAKALPTNAQVISPLARRRSLPKVHSQASILQRVSGHKPSKSAQFSVPTRQIAYPAAPLPMPADAQPALLSASQPSEQLPSPCDSLTPPNEGTKDFSLNQSMMTTDGNPTLGNPYGGQLGSIRDLKGGVQAHPRDYTDISQDIDGMQEPLFDMLNGDVWQTTDLDNATILASVNPLEDIQMPQDQPFGSALASPEPQPLFH